MTGNLLILMNSSYEKGSDDSGSLTVDLAVVRKVWLIILSTLYGPSLICYLVILFWMSKIRDLWTRLTNHIIIANFLVNLIQATCELPFTLAFFANGYVPFPNFYFCKFWLSFEFSLNVSTLFLNAQLAFERYLLIFHHNLLYRHKIILHFAPMVILILIAFLYSCGTVLFFPCEENFDYTFQVCGGSCYQFNRFMGTFDNVLTVYLPIISITIFTGTLIIRVLYQKRKMQQKNIWKKNLRMLTQLLSIVILHFISWMPTCILLTITAAATTHPELVPIIQYVWVFFSCLYIGVLGSPFTTLFALPEVNEKASQVMRRVLGKTQDARVHVLSTNTRQVPVTNTQQSRQ